MGGREGLILHRRIASSLPVASWLGVGLCLALLAGCDRSEQPAEAVGEEPARPGGETVAPPEPSPTFRNIESATAYVGDEVCAACHEEAAAAYETHAMSRSFHRWTPETRVETPFDEPLQHRPTGFRYSIVDDGGALYQEEYLEGPEGGRLHELRRRMDWVMGSGNVARTYFTEENGRLFQLPVTWYREGGWDFSPGYELNNARFERLLPDRCLACHGSYPDTIGFLEGKYARLPPGIGCERCHGPGALHSEARADDARPAAVTADGHDDTIVDPGRLPFERRLDVCEQCHVHTPVTVLREGRDAFDFVPSEPLSEHAAFFKAAGSIDIVSHADRLRQSACFIATRPTERPLECATCHDPHAAAAEPAGHNATCQTCHAPADVRQRVAGGAARHAADADCVGCHMPSVKERTVPHGSFTDHWIRVVGSAAEAQGDSAGERAESAPGNGGSPVEPYFERDRSGPEADIYRGMGEVVFATLASDAEMLSRAAGELERALGPDAGRSDAAGGDAVHGDARFLLGLAYRQLGRTEEAIGALELAVEADPARPQRLHALARAYESSGRDPTTVEPLYQRALALQPALAWIRADYARFLQGEGRREEAGDAYRAALAERPSLAVAAFDLGTLMAETGRLRESSDAFGQAVRLDPTLAEALSPLLQIRVSGDAVTGARVLGSPLGNLPLRSRGPGVLRLLAGSGGTQPGVRFVGVPAGATVQVIEPDGALVRAITSQAEPAATWDLRTASGRPVASGLYYAQLAGRDPSGRPLPPQRIPIGVVRLGG